MSTNPLLLRGDLLADATNSDSARRATRFHSETGVRPTLATILVGDDLASATYVRMKERRATRAGIRTRHVDLPASTDTTRLVDTVAALSDDPDVHGILLQHPVGEHIDERTAFDAIAPQKDVDGVTSASFAAMTLGGTGFASCTPGGIIRLLDHYGVTVRGANTVVIGRSPILGKPMAALLLRRDATVTVCHSRTRNLADHIAAADLVVAAVGQPELVRGEWIKPGAVVIDAGYNPGNVGDVDFAGASRRASMITPVPGGVGPMTIATLLSQTIDAAEASVDSSSGVAGPRPTAE
ncbi:Bifunctional protein FolD OS=Tsukamurella paurometabola (strain ATCC 8368 / DSM / CCUG 35730/ CIP 100753 / JCM 10117 / KCTC 9821 / NBRC 16120 / NCIMB 702349/ NCTC 13040) OX=521096 GN=folD PE=3 SV=1 [Tsukamurella paurometabola]|uniref:Bifunctional protein FolD n=1 Tax=Tsukamurella paurometabola (strain ATCC 8368 / DSM 20162 / CCUG 35730 / CIP 100753 / JCM 10117 / KCTC 9821 / NBRC 16120 / NCIMB 702349 / NCTC 13040) TaxID=521096 RepID=D5UN23_TSUPD|nr:tetrahydrofolate dehydrogenase/cyclohydrolase catalytic domain-containing protein [Tsukamurella paurometabola]ADG78520.1 Methylenetetrahydrofolate dehydrogenase (NADP(+)) [Tsukamurella paurometabola DSM 20162]SUP32017.1 Bifunctional protein FolD [Tsukamurella paurometabola]